MEAATIPILESFRHIFLKVSTAEVFRMNVRGGEEVALLTFKLSYDAKAVNIPAITFAAKVEIYHILHMYPAGTTLESKKKCKILF